MTAYQLFQLPKNTQIDSSVRVTPGALAHFYATTTTTPQDTYTDAALTIPSANPVVADANGVFQAIYLDPTLIYKLTLTTSAGVLIYSVDPVNDQVLSALSVGGALWPETAAEQSVGSTPTTTAYEPYKSPPRYGTFGDASTDDASAIQRQINACGASGSELDLWGTTSLGYHIETPLAIPSGLKFKGGGFGRCAIRANGCNAFTIPAGASQVELSGFRINSVVRHSITPNTLKGIDTQGTTASSCNYHTYRDLFIDGFETPIQANAIRETVIHNVQSVFGKHGIVSHQLSGNVFVSSCNLSGSGASSYGIQIGDGTEPAEGWVINNNLMFGFSAGVFCLGSSHNIITGNIIDFFSEYGVLVASSGALAATNCTIIGNQMNCGAAGGNAGIRLLNSVVSSDPRGSIIANNIVIYYLFGGAALAYGIRVDGTEEIYNTIQGNHIRGSVYDCYTNTGTGTIVTGNQWIGPGFATDVPVIYDNNTGTVIGGIIPTVASAAALTLPPGPTAYYISGTTNITSIDATDHFGDTVRLIFQGALTFTKGSNLKLSANFVTTADDTITLYCDGANYYELCRSAN